MLTVRFTREPWDDPDGRALRADMLALVTERLGGVAPPQDVLAEPEDLLAWVMARDAQGAPLGCAALCAPAELRRMYVRPAARNLGVARALLAEIEDEAQARGLEVLTLHTTDVLGEARALYASAGYRTTHAIGLAGRVDLWMEKRLGHR